MKQTEVTTIAQYLDQLPLYYAKLKKDLLIVDQRVKEQQDYIQIPNLDHLKELLASILLNHFSLQTQAKFLQVIQEFTKLKEIDVKFNLNELEFVQLCRLLLVDKKSNLYYSIMVEKELKIAFEQI